MNCTCIPFHHCGCNLVLQIIWKKLFTTYAKDAGSLGHLFTLIGRLPQARKPKDDLHACLDALRTVFKGHIITVACSELGLKSPDVDMPALEDGQLYVRELAKKIVMKNSIVTKAIVGEPFEETKDGIHNYAKVLCHYAALVTEFTDAWSEGDGLRVLRCWKIFMLHFHADRRTKYALEALLLQFQLASLPPDLVHQLTWGRFVNTHGGLGHNIPCDLHNEHVNRLFKEMVNNMGANFTPESSTRAARAVTTLEELSKKFDCETGIHPELTAHSRKSDENDVKHVVNVLQHVKPHMIQEGRCYTKFPEISGNPLKALDRDKFHLWIKEKIKKQKKHKIITEGNTTDQEASDDES